MSQFESHNQPQIPEELAEIDLGEITEELVKSGVAGSKKITENGGHDFMQEATQRVVPEKNRGQDNHI